jgi:hypothetical protein
MTQDSSAATPFLNRRAMLAGTAGIGLALVLVPREALGALAKTAGPKLTMYKNPSCGCCGKWGEAARAAGFQVEVVPTADMRSLKGKLGVPDELISCHTSTVGGYVVEGHVPLDAVERLLKQRPRIKGIAVPGMPIGSPGMEVPGAEKQPFDVMAFDSAGKISRFG